MPIPSLLTLARETSVTGRLTLFTMAAAEPKRRKFDINFKENVLEYAAEHSGEQAAKHFDIDPKRKKFKKANVFKTEMASHCDVAPQ